MKPSLDQVKEFLRDAAVLNWMRIKERRKNGNRGSSPRRQIWGLVKSSF